MAKTRIPVNRTVGRSVQTVTSVDTSDLTTAIANLNIAVGKLQAAAAANPSGLSPTVWSLISEIPNNIVDIAALISHGLLQRNQDGTWVLVPPPPPGQPGIDGEQGVDGERGAPGSPGVAGAVGLRGPPGEDGLPGDDGSQGPPGPVGPAGSGSTGAQGPMGTPGTEGADGQDGDRGPPGPSGPAGGAGATGPQGPLGFGMDGEVGADGDRGPPGPQGIQGVTGPTGPIGSALYQISFGDDSGGGSDDSMIYTGDLQLGAARSWLGSHSFYGAVDINVSRNHVTLGDFGSGAIGIGILNTVPAANNRFWALYEDSAGTLNIAAVNDANSVSSSPLSITRSGTTITGIALNGLTTVTAAAGGDLQRWSDGTVIGSYQTSGVNAYIGTISNHNFNLVTNNVTRMGCANDGSLFNFLSTQIKFSSAANVEYVSIIGAATTGGQTAVFTGVVNKPGSSTTSPGKWLPVSFGGTTYYIPMFL